MIVAEAEVLCREVVDQLRPEAYTGNVETANYVAWLLATGDLLGFRDGRSAVGYAERAVTATSRTNMNYLDTLAASYAADGKFKEAVDAQNEAIAGLLDAKQKQDFTSRLKLYESGFPYRQTE
jgi:hypothetical protein